MEHCLQSMVKDLSSASGEREKKIKEACEKALVLLGQATLTNVTVELKKSWAGFIQPFYLGLASRNPRVVLSSLQGLQTAANALLDSEVDSVAIEHLNTVVNNIVDCTCTANEVQRERIKIILALVSANPSFVHGEQLERVFEACLEAQSSAKQAATKTAALAATRQMIHLLGRQLQDYCKACSELEDGASSWTGPPVAADYLLLLKLWTGSLQDFKSQASRSLTAFLCEVSALEALLANTTSELVRWRIDVSSVLRDQLVPGLTAVFNHFNESTPFRLNPTAATTTKIKRCILMQLGNITAHMVTLMGPVTFLRPAMTALLHAFIRSPPPEKRAIVLQHCVHKIFSSLNSLLALAGPVESGSATMETVAFGDAQLDLLNQLLIAVVECVSCGDAEARKAGVACVVAFVATLEQLHDGKEGLSQTITRSLQVFAKGMPHKNTSPPQLDLASLLGGSVAVSNMTPPEGSMHFEVTGTAEDRPEDEASATKSDADSGAEVDTVTSTAASADPTAAMPSGEDSGAAVEIKASPSRAAASSADDGDDEEKEDDVQTVGVANGADDLNLGQVSPTPISRSAGPCVALDNAELFVKMLTASLPALMRIANPDSLDLKIQQMASMFCRLSAKDAPIPDQVKAVELNKPLHEPSAVAAGQESEAGLSVLTADSVYIASYAAMAASLYLLKEDFHFSQASSADDIPLPKEAFSKSMTDCGVLLSLSPQWIDRLYSLLLANDILSKAGYRNDEGLCLSTGSEVPGSGRDDTQQNILVDTLIATFPVLAPWEKPIVDSLTEKADSEALNLMLGDEALGGIADGNTSESDDVLPGSSRGPLLKFNEVQPPLSSLVDESVRVFLCKDLLQSAWRNTLLSLQLPLKVHSPAATQAALQAAIPGSGGETKLGPTTNRSQGSFPLSLPTSSSNKSVPDADTMVSCLNGLRLVARLSCRLAMQYQCAEVLAILAEAALEKSPATVNGPSPQKKAEAKAASRSRASDTAAAGPTGSDDSVKKRASVLSALRSVSLKNMDKPAASAARSSKSSSGGGGSSEPSGHPPSAAAAGSSSVPIVQLSHALCLEAMFKLGLQSAVDAPQCWGHVLRCCAYVADVEASLFSALRAPSPSHSPGPPQLQSTGQANETDSLATLLRHDETSGRPTSPSETLSESNMIQAISHLSFLAERLFDNAAQLLTLPSLVTFIEFLCRASNEQLHARGRNPSGANDPTAGLLIRRLTPLLMTACSKAHRPLLHILKIWCTVSQHLVEAACFKERAVAQIATDCLRQVMSECIQSRAEMPLFSFHKTLLKPMESILSLNLCDMDTQDQIVCSLCELVEASRINISSGWSVVFGALRSVRLKAPSKEPTTDRDSPSSTNANPVMDIIDSVLKSDNAALISDAALDCVECMIKFLSAGHSQNEVLARKALFGVSMCHDLFCSIHELSSYPDFRGAAEIQDSNGDCASIFSTDSTGLLRVWFLLFRGMCDALPLCPAAVQPHLVDELFSLLERAWSGIPGKPFAMKVLEELLMPSLHRWLQGGINLGLKWRRSEVHSFKHCCGRLVSQVSDLVLPVLDGGQEETNTAQFVKSAGEMMQSVMDLMVDCIIQPEEALATMGNASLRFLLLGNGGQLPKDLWQQACNSLSQALRLTLQPLEMVLGQFEPHRRGLGGRQDRVKITCKRNMTVATAFRVLHLAKQAFVLPSELQELQRVTAELADSRDNSRAPSPEKTAATVLKPPAESEATLTIHDQDLHSTIEECAASSTRATESFSFFWSVPLPSASLFRRASTLTQAPEENDSAGEDRAGNAKRKKVRVPFRSLTVSLVTHQLVLHTLSDVLLGEGAGEGIEHRPSAGTPTRTGSDGLLDNGVGTVLQQVTPEQLDMLLDGILTSSQLACSFNRRPGFRLAVAKVGALEQHFPHLLRQVGASLRLYIHCLLHLLTCSSDALTAWFRRAECNGNDDHDHDDNSGADTAEATIEDVLTKPSIIKDVSAAVDSQRSAEDTVNGGETAFDRQAVITKSQAPPSKALQALVEGDLLRLVAKRTDGSPALQWVAIRAALMVQRLVSYTMQLFHQHEVDTVEDEARLLSERDGDGSESTSTNVLISDLQAVPVCITSQEWRNLELDQWLSLLEGVIQRVCSFEDKHFTNAVPLLYSPLTELCVLQNGRVQAAVKSFFTRYGQLQGLIPMPED